MSEHISNQWRIAEWRMPSASGEFLLRMPIRPNSADADDFIELLELIQKQARRRRDQNLAEKTAKNEEREPCPT